MKGELKARVEVLTLVFSIATTVIAYFAYEHSKQELWITKNVDLYLKRVEMYDVLMHYLKTERFFQRATDKFIGLNYPVNSQESGKYLHYQFSEKVMKKIAKDYFGLDVKNKIDDLMKKCQELKNENSDMGHLLSMLEEEYYSDGLKLEKYKDAIRDDGCDFISEGEQADINKLLDNLGYFESDEHHLGLREDYNYRTIEVRIRELSKEIDDGLKEISDLILSRIPFDQPLDETLLSKIKKSKRKFYKGGEA